MRPVEIIALFFASFGLIKLIVIYIDPKSWISFVKKIYSKPVFTIPISLTLGLVNAKKPHNHPF